MSAVPFSFWQPPVASGAPPEITSLDFAVGDPAGGGQDVTITGTNLDTVTGVTFGGASSTITGQTTTTVTVTLPAHAAGLVDVVVTNPDGSDTATNGFEFWDPTQLTDVVAVWDAEKGVTDSSGVTDWLDQTSNGNDLAESTNKFTYTATAFGTLHGLTSSGGSAVLTGSRNVQNAGRSVFWVAKYTSTKNFALSYMGNCPLTVIGDASGSVNNNAGHNADALSYQNYEGSFVETTRGSGLNDGNPHLFGWTHDLSGDLKAYVDGAQEGATESGRTYDNTAAAYNTIGQGFGGTNLDGFVGTLGAAIVVNAIISGGELTKLTAWSQQRWSTP